MNKYWQKAIIILLCVILLPVLINYAIVSSDYRALRGEHKKTQQTLVNQTQLIVELRQKAIPHNFESYDELKRWVDAWKLENKPIAISVLNHTFVLAGNDVLYSQYWDCDDISEAMQRDALGDGYLMSICLVSMAGNILDHAGCLAITDNGYWFIEPQTGEITLTARRD